MMGSTSVPVMIISFQVQSMVISSGMVTYDPTRGHQRPLTVCLSWSQNHNLEQRKNESYSMSHRFQNLLCVSHPPSSCTRRYNYSFQLKVQFLVLKIHLNIKSYILCHFCANKVGCVFPIVVVSILPHTDFGQNGHSEDTPHFIIFTVWHVRLSND